MLFVQDYMLNKQITCQNVQCTWYLYQVIVSEISQTYMYDRMLFKHLIGQNRNKL